eukprot:6450092-Alexandrium_andersonii.AAC.1
MCSRLLGDPTEDGGRRGSGTHGFSDRLVGVWPMVGWACMEVPWRMGVHPWGLMHRDSAWWVGIESRQAGFAAARARCRGDSPPGLCLCHGWDWAERGR